MERKTKEWLENLSPGDYVIVSTSGPLSKDIAAKVERLTKTQIILEGSKTKYRRDNGYNVGDAWSRSFLREATKERLKEVITNTKRRKLANRLNNVEWFEYRLETLEAAVSVLEKESEKE